VTLEYRKDIAIAQTLSLTDMVIIVLGTLWMPDFACRAHVPVRNFKKNKLTIKTDVCLSILF
jgi:hypothetical protein